LLYGSFAGAGVAIEAHDFCLAAHFDWARSFHPGGIELCLNLAGGGEVRAGRQRTEFRAQTAGIYAAGTGAITARRNPGEEHRFVTVEMRRDFLAQQLTGCETAIDPALRAKVLGDRETSFAGTSRALTTRQTALVEQLATPPVAAAAMPLWYQGKVSELLAETFFAPESELFCARQQRLARERVERVQAILQARLEEPPSLEELGRDVGVSQFYLSRIFSQEMRMTIPQYLRRLRMERAAVLLREGRHNVTEAAFAVGYSSLGHFSKSFCEVMGCCPTLYPQARHLARG
jgi:AraC-like DNA-binding protein